MKITVYCQHLDGNDPENFNTEAWLGALEAEYREICESHFPGAEVVIDVDRQRRCSGNTRPVDVEFDEPEEIDFKARQSLKRAIEYAENDLWESAQRDEFFDEGEKP